MITIEKNSKIEIRLEVTPLSPGQLVILKAMFPDKEPTDHEIRAGGIRFLT